MKISLFYGSGMTFVFDKPTTAQFRTSMEGISISTILQNGVLKDFLAIKQFIDIEYILKSIQDIDEFSKTLGAKFFFNISQISSNLMTKYDGHNYSYEDLVEAIKKLKVRIENLVFEHYSWNHNKDKLLQSIFDPIIEQCHVTDNELRVFTTNYDQAFEVYCSKSSNFNCNDGFKLDESQTHFLWNNGDYNELDVNGKINFKLYKLHGSLNWKNHINYGVERTTFERKSTDPNYDKNILIYPSLAPKDGMINEPYKTIREKFKEYLLQSDICIVIGFSFRDEHLNDIFNQFIAKNKRLVIISPSAKKKLKILIPGNDGITWDEHDNEFDVHQYNIGGMDEGISLDTIQLVSNFIDFEIKKTFVLANQNTNP